MTRAPLYEVFSSVQGEATRVGERHLFVRMAGCDLECRFCDTPASHRIPDRARIFLPEGVREEENPMEAETLDRWVRALDDAAGPHHAVSLTGGEPLLFAEFLAPLCARWRARGLPVLLESGGHRPAELARLIGCIDIVMADIKLRSSSGLATDPATTREFLAIASRVECAVKIVVSAATTEDEVRAALALVPGPLPIVLQPVSGSAFQPPSGEHLLRLQRAAMAVHRSVRVIPQVHRQLHLR